MEQSFERRPTPGGYQKRDSSQALALIAIAVGATSQLTMGEGFFSLWSTMVGIILLLLIHAYEGDVGAGWPERIALAAIKAYSWIFAIGIIIDLPFALGPRTFVRDLNACYAFYNLADDSLQCFIGNRDVLIFAIWLSLFFVFFSTWRRKKLKTMVMP
jgi:hypothetical protein